MKIRIKLRKYDIPEGVYTYRDLGYSRASWKYICVDRGRIFYEFVTDANGNKQIGKVQAHTPYKEEISRIERGQYIKIEIDEDKSKT